MNNYAEAFKEMIQGLKSDPSIAVVSSYIYPPASDSEISEAEAIMRCKLDESLLSFYRSCNGVQLRWIRRDSEDFNEAEFGNYSEGPVTLAEIMEDDMRTDGCINIRPLLEVARKEVGWSMKPNKLYVDTYTIEGEVFSPSAFCENAMVWDAVDSSRGVVLFPLRKSGIQICMLASLRYSTCEDSVKILPNAYLDFLLQTKGVNKVRAKSFDIELGIAENLASNLIF